MASERQIAANRLNARKSTGPRSGAGKKRASGNAYRHGLSLHIISTAALAEQLDKLVREIAGDMGRAWRDATPNSAEKRSAVCVRSTSAGVVKVGQASSLSALCSVARRF